MSITSISQDPKVNLIKEANMSYRLYLVIRYTNSINGKGNNIQIRIVIKDLSTHRSFTISRKTDWSATKQLMCISNKIPTATQREYKRINYMIVAMKKAYSQFIYQHEVDKRNISPAELERKTLENTLYSIVREIENQPEIISTEATDSSKYITDYWAKHIEMMITGKVRNDGKRYAKATITAHRKCRNNLLKYEEDTNQKLSFNDIDTYFDSDLRTYFEKKLIGNSIAELIKNIKHIMRVAQLDGLHSNEDYKLFNARGEISDNVYLTEEELRTIAELDLSTPKDQFLEKYRDVFLIGCYTALRAGDLLKLSKKNLIKNGETEMLKVKTGKTGTTVYIPMLWEDLKKRLEKYNYAIPEMTEQKLSKYIKEVCRIAEINTPVLIQNGQYKRDEPYEKWELISVHTARRTACTNLYLRGIPSISIMKISGHKKESTFLKYIKITDEENAKLIAQKFKDSF